MPDQTKLVFCNQPKVAVSYPLISGRGTAAEPSQRSTMERAILVLARISSMKSVAPHLVDESEGIGLESS